MTQPIDAVKTSRKPLALHKSELHTELQSKDHRYIIDKAFWATSWSDMHLHVILSPLIKLI